MWSTIGILWTLVGVGAPWAGQPAQATHSRPLGERYGFNIHFTDPKPGELEQLAATGVRWVRMDMTWSRIERSPGVYDFSAYDRLTAALQAHGLRALWILDYGNPLYDGGQAPRTPEGRAAFARWAAACVERYRGRGHVWEIWNEPNLRQFWKPEPSPADYVALAQETIHAIRSVAPNEAIVGPATSGFDWDFLRRCFEGGLLSSWTAVTIHPYRKEPPETVAAEYAQLRDMIRRARPSSSVAIMSGEWGYSDVWNGMDRDRQGLYLFRQWLVNAACGVALSIWYDWRDDGLDPKEPEHHFGVVEHRWRPDVSPPFQPKPAWTAATVFHRELGAYRFVRRCAVPRARGPAYPEDWVLLFQDGPRWKIAAWTIGSEAFLRWPGVRAPLVGCNHLGEPQTNGVLEGADLILRVTEVPFIATVPSESAERLREASPWDWEDFRVEQMLVVPARTGGWALQVVPRFGPPFAGTVRIMAHDGRTNMVQVLLNEERVPVQVAWPPEFPPQRGWLEFVREDGRVIALQPSWAWVPIAADWAHQVRLVVGYDGRPPIAGNWHLEHRAADSSAEAAALSTSEVTVRWAVAPGYKYFTLEPREPSSAQLPGAPEQLGVWIRNRGGPIRLTCRICDRAGEVFQPRGVELKHDLDWKFVYWPLWTRETIHWGGDGNGRPDLPLRWQAWLLLDPPDEVGSTNEVTWVTPLWVVRP